MFDLDETLAAESVAVDAALREALTDAQSRYGLNPEQVVSNLKRVLLHSPDRSLPAWLLISARAEQWEAALERSGVSDRSLAVAVTSCFRDRFLDGARLFDDVPETLRAIGARYSLGLITNGSAEVRRAELERLALTDYFETIVISGEHRVAKPEPQLFKYALDDLGCRASEALHVGDDPLEDVLGAKATGIYACWLNRNNLVFPADMPPPDLAVHNLYELIEALGS